MTIDIPEIDISPLFDKSDSTGFETVAKKLEAAYTKVGFAYIFGYPIDESLLKTFFETSREFFHLPEATKSNYPIAGSSGSGFAGISDAPFQASNLGRFEQTNQYESFRFKCLTGNDLNDFLQDDFQKENLWPDLYRAHLDSIHALVKSIFHCFNHIVQAFAVAFGLERHALDSLFEQTNIGMKAHYYPEHPDHLENDAYTLFPHTDFVFVTLLATDGNPGLEVQDDAGKWHQVPFKPNRLILNTGEVIERLTNDHFIATRHRVVTPPNVERLSMPVFLNPEADQIIEPLKHFIKPGEKSHYPPTRFGDIIKSYMRKK